MTKTVLLTGATSGVGFQIAKSLLHSGNRVVLIGRDSDKLSQLSSRLGIGEENFFEFDNLDINQNDKVKSLFKAIVKNFGKLDSLICCAGFHQVKPLKVCKSEDFNLSFLLNAQCAFVFSKFFASSLYSSGDNRSIVFISSIASLLGEAGLVGYSASKGALVSGARGIAQELSGKNIRVNCISPGWVNTEHASIVAEQLGEDRVEELKRLYPLGFGEPQYIADACEFLISSKSKWITGQNIVVDGGRTLS
jgi:NAD(P)-dependent dehydrogenase (short-subunit alcohol dehydrogenase family)